jgi:Type VI secretion system (T6SS), amidase effector protein 4
MPGRRPGPWWDSTLNPDDEVGYLGHAVIPGPLLSIADDPYEKKLDLRFQKLWSSYPADQPYVDAKGNPPKGYENQCAIKVSVALRGCGVDLRRFKGATVQVGIERHAIRAQELATWLRSDAPRRLRTRRRQVTGSDWEAKCSGKTGILYFEDYWLREGEQIPSGDHIPESVASVRAHGHCSSLTRLRSANRRSLHVNSRWSAAIASPSRPACSA